MNIAFMVYEDLSIITGGNIYDSMLINYLRKRGNKVDIITLCRDERNLQPQQAILRNIKNNNWDIVIQDELCHPILYKINRNIVKKMDIPIISLVHHLKRDEDCQWCKKIRSNYVEKQYLKTVDAFICNSETTKQSIVAVRKGETLSVVAIPGKNRLCNIDSNKIKRVKKRDQNEPLHILFLGNIIPRKALHDLLYALTEVNEKKWILHVVGSKKRNERYTRSIYRIIQKHSLQKNVLFYDYVSDERLINIFKKTHVMVIPSHYEGIGIAYIEAMGYGLPTIGTRSGGCHEVITHEYNGYLCESGNSDSIRYYLERLIENNEIIKELSRNAFERYNVLPRWEEICERILVFIKQIKTLHVNCT